MRKIQKIEEMFLLQARLNDETNGPNWREGKTRQGKVIDWPRCVVMETAELIDSFPWKHWKGIDASPDWENIRIEIVDIWHFVMSEALRHYTCGEAAKMALETHRRKEAPIPRTWGPKEHTMLDRYLRPFEALMRTALLSDGSADAARGLTAAFWVAADAAGVELEALYELYIGKNVLNRFRQMHGYKEGTYRKEWNGEEDNAVMQRILRERPDLDADGLMAALEEAYAKI